MNREAERALPSELRARVLASIQAQPSPAIGAVNRTHVVAVVLGFVPCAVLFEVLGACVQGSRPPGYVALLGIGWALLATLGSWGALARGRSMLGRPAALLLAMTVATPVLLLAIGFAGYIFWPEAMVGNCGPGGHATCFAYGALMAAGPLVAFAFARRHSDPVHPHVTGAALGASAGAWGALAIGVHCPVSAPLHMVLGHVLPVVLVTCIGMWMGGRRVAIRTETK